MIDRQVAITLYDKGVSLREIGEIFGVSKQRVNQVLRQELVPKHRQFTKGTSYNKSEKYVSDRLTLMGIQNKIMPYGADYDIHTAEGVRVEVKYRSHPGNHRANGNNYPMYTFRFLRKAFDIAVVVLGDLSNPMVYVFNKEEIGRGLSIRAFPKNKSKKLDAARYAWNRVKLTY